MSKVKGVSKPEGITVTNGDTLATDLTQFGFEGEPVRAVIGDDGMPWFNSHDVCTALGYENPRKAVADHVDEEDRNTVSIRYGIRGNPNKTFVNESGLYALIFGSGKPKAKRFKRWVTSEVLPAIRRTSEYRMGNAPARPAIKSDDEFALSPVFFARLYYAMDKRLGAATLIWYLIEHGAHDRWVTSSARKIAEDIGLAVRYSTINKFSMVLAEEGILDLRMGNSGTPSSYKLIRPALRRVLKAVPLEGDERPGLDLMQLIADQNRLLRAH